MTRTVRVRRRNFNTMERRALWVSSDLSSFGGISTFVRNMQQTDLWRTWNIRHVATHCDGTKSARIAIFLKGIFFFLAELIGRRPDVVHLHTSERGSIVRKGVLVWISALFRVPVVLHMHGGAFSDFFEKSPRPIQAIVRRTLAQADAVVALGDTWADYFRGVSPAADVVMIPNSIRLATPQDLTTPGVVNVVFLGKVCEDKGTFILLEAWAQMLARSRIPQAKLKLAGQGELALAAERIEKLGIGGSVDVCGRLTPAAVSTLLADTHILVLPSLIECQPMSILEAMTRGICVVASTAGGIPEMIGDSDGLLVSPGDTKQLSDAMERVISDQELRCELGANGRKRVDADFNLDRVASRLDDLYLRLTLRP
jgi:glycosyltransferase involved in cell wall biosynthesis